MKFLLPIMLLLTGCTTKVNGVECIGISDKETTGVEYEISKMNIIWGVLFVETAIVPVNVILYNWKCPVEKK